MGIELVTPEMKALLKNKKIPQPAERKQIITDAHSQGHMGIQQTFLRIWHKGFWWPSVRQDIADHLSGCLQCLRFSVRREGFHPLTPIIEDWPGNGWSMDLFFLDKSTNKNVVLIAIDIATGFILDLAPVLSKDKHTIAEEVWKIICTYGPPKYIISDNGAEFVNRHMKALLDKIGVVHRTIASYHPQANGKVERTIKDVKEMIRKMSDADYRFSPSYLPYCKLCYNTHLSSRTNSSPFSLMFGREALAFDNYLGSAKMLPADIAKIQKHWKTIREGVYPAIQDFVKNRESIRAAKWDATHNVIDGFTPGQYVMAKDVTRGTKWNDKYLGPFKVVHRGRNGTYKLENALGEVEKYRFPPDHLIPVGDYEFPEEQSFEIRKIKGVRGSAPNKEYLVEFRDKDSPDEWISEDLVDAKSAIQKFFKANPDYEEDYVKPVTEEEAGEFLDGLLKDHETEETGASPEEGVVPLNQDTIPAVTEAAATTATAASGDNSSAGTTTPVEPEATVTPPPKRRRKDDLSSTYKFPSVLEEGDVVKGIRSRHSRHSSSSSSSSH